MAQYDAAPFHAECDIASPSLLRPLHASPSRALPRLAPVRMDDYYCSLERQNRIDPVPECLYLHAVIKPEEQPSLQSS